MSREVNHLRQLVHIKSDHIPRNRLGSFLRNDTPFAVFCKTSTVSVFTTQRGGNWVLCITIWVFPKIKYPSIIHFNMVRGYKPSILGYPYCWKHILFKQHLENWNPPYLSIGRARNLLGLAPCFFPGTLKPWRPNCASRVGVSLGLQKDQRLDKPGNKEGNRATVIIAMNIQHFSWWLNQPLWKIWK